MEKSLETAPVAYRSRTRESSDFALKIEAPKSHDFGYRWF
jgi:hypothetical protein